MKNHIFIPLLLVFILTGCGKDGMDGNTFLQFSWDPYVDSYWDNNPDTPDIIMSKTFYRVYAGMYSFEYVCHDMLGNPFGIDGTYQILVNKGGKGKFLSSGKDGPNFAKTTTVIKQPQWLSSATAVNSLLEKAYIGKSEIDTVYSNGFTIIITSQNFQLKVSKQ